MDTKRVGRKRTYMEGEKKLCSCKKAKTSKHLLTQSISELHHQSQVLCDDCFYDGQVCYLRERSPKFHKMPLMYKACNNKKKPCVLISSPVTKITSWDVNK